MRRLAILIVLPALLCVAVPLAVVDVLRGKPCR